VQPKQIIDNDGNLVTKTSPAPNQTGSSTVTVAYCYDALNRSTSKAYTTSTTCPQTSPVATYLYDQTSYNGLTITNGIGHRTGMTDAAGAEAWSYDAMGRPLTDQRTTNGVTKLTVYTYNLDGSMATLTYPSSHAITYTLQSSGTNTAGRLLSAVDTANSINYATAASYAPGGGLLSLTNGASLLSSLYYNSRFQPCRISAKFSGTAPTSCTDSANIGNVLDFAYNFSLGASDNGNVTGVTNNRDNTRSQSFTYDSLNRILTAKTSSTSGANCWDEQFGYDPWGNFLSIGRISGYTCSNEELLSVAATTKNQVSGYTYDSAGNLINDNAGHTYTYSAENQLVTAGGVTYAYDGDGKRAQKSGGKLYWYGMGSDPLDETDLSGNSNNATFAEYIFFNNQRIARRDYLNNVNYYFSDHLGTARVVANASGSILDDSDFYPFGGERVVSSSSGNRYKFTGKERDFESNLDNFGARFDSSSLGRFMSPDPDNAGASPDSPQSWNAYSYVLNNPLNVIDPDGLDCVYLNNAGSGVESIDRDSTQKECNDPKNGGTWFDGTINSNSVRTDPNSDWVSAEGVVEPMGSNQQFSCGGNACGQDALNSFADTIIGGPGSVTVSDDVPLTDEQRMIFTLAAVETEHAMGCVAIPGAGLLAGGTAFRLGQPIPGSKPFVTPGSSTGTSRASAALREAMPQKMPFRVPTPVGGPGTGTPLRMAATNRLGAALGRYVPYAAAAVAAYSSYKDDTMFEQETIMGLLYVFGAFLLFIAVWVVVDQVRLSRLRHQRQAKGFSQAQFVEAFRQLGVPDNIPAAVYLYYVSQKAWKNFPFSPDDKYSSVLHDDPWELEDDGRALAEELGILFLPEYIRQGWGDKPIKTLRDMVLWLDWMRQNQPSTAEASARSSRIHTAN
jgi:RHS repeat-associated protein